MRNKNKSFLVQTFFDKHDDIFVIAILCMESFLHG